MPEKYITDYLKDNATNVPDKLALVFQNEKLSWHQLNTRVEAVANVIAERIGGKKQQIIGTLMPNSIELVIAYLAILEAGHIAMPLDVIYKPLELNAVIEQMRPQAVITDTVNINRINKNNNLWLVSDLLTSPNKAGARVRLGPKQQIATLVFTSGTTGSPKATPHSHSSHIWNIAVCTQAWGWRPDDTMLLSLRLSHWYGLCMGLSGAIYHSNTVYLQENFDAETTLKTLASGKVSLFTHTPIAYAKMLEQSGDYDISSVRLMISGSSALAPDIWQQFKKRYHVEIIECYGSSETGRIASNTADDRRPGTPGKPLPGVKYKLDPKNQLLVKSAGLFGGYYHNPAATAKSIDGEGFWRTGDIAEIRDGYIFLKGRLQESIRKLGYTISPRDVEWALRKNSSITDCLVLGDADPAGDDRLIYFIVGQISEDQIVEYSKQHLPSIWRADKIITLTSIPRLPSGKPALSKLRKML